MFRSVEGWTCVPSCGGSPSSYVGVVDCHQVIMHRLSRGIFCGPPSLSGLQGYGLYFLSRIMAVIHLSLLLQGDMFCFLTEHFTYLSSMQGNHLLLAML